MEDAAALGRRIRELRRRRRLSLEAAAGLAGISRAMLSYVERGQRVLQRRGHIEGLAYALQVAPSELLGLPYPATDRERSAAQANIDEIRGALVGTEIGYAPSQPTAALADLERATDDLCAALYRRGDYAAASEDLADTILQLHGYTVDAPEQQEFRALRMLVVACCTACAIAKEVGYPDLAWIAAERARQAAHRLDDPVRMGVVALYLGYALESHRRDLVNCERALAGLDPRVGDDRVAMQVMGNLHLRCAYGNAVFGTAEAVRAHLDEAARLAERTGGGTDFNLFFGPTNMRIWQLAIALERGEGTRAPQIADGTNIDAMPSRWRRAMFYTDLGRGLAQVRRDDDALAAFLTAERLAPVYVRNNPYARETVLDVRHRARRAAVGKEFSGLVYRMGLT